MGVKSLTNRAKGDFFQKIASELDLDPFINHLTNKQSSEVFLSDIELKQLENLRNIEKFRKNDRKVRNSCIQLIKRLFSTPIAHSESCIFISRPWNYGEPLFWNTAFEKSFLNDRASSL